MMDFGKLNFSISFNPTSAFPLDSRYYFESLSDAEQAASEAVEVGSTDGTYFIGEPLVVVEYSSSRIPTSVNLYVINKNKELEKVILNSDMIARLTESEERSNEKIDILRSDTNSEFEKTSNEIYLNNFIVNGMMVFSINENGAMVPDVDGPYLLTVTEDYGIFFKYLTQFELDPTVGALAINY